MAKNAKADPIIQEARERMRRAVGHAKAAAAELRAAKRAATRHPDFRPLESRGTKKITLAQWYVEYLKAALKEYPIVEAAGWIKQDLHGTRRTMEACIRQEAKDVARFRRVRGAA
jgi:hypothetical protein